MNLKLVRFWVVMALVMTLNTPMAKGAELYAVRTGSDIGMDSRNYNATYDLDYVYMNITDNTPDALGLHIVFQKSLLKTQFNGSSDAKFELILDNGKNQSNPWVINLEKVDFTYPEKSQTPFLLRNKQNEICEVQWLPYTNYLLFFLPRVCLEIKEYINISASTSFANGKSNAASDKMSAKFVSIPLTGYLLQLENETKQKAESDAKNALAANEARTKAAEAKLKELGLSEDSRECNWFEKSEYVPNPMYRELADGEYSYMREWWEGEEYLYACLVRTWEYRKTKNSFDTFHYLEIDSGSKDDYAEADKLLQIVCRKKSISVFIEQDFADSVGWTGSGELKVDNGKVTQFKYQITREFDSIFVSNANSFISKISKAKKTFDIRLTRFGKYQLINYPISDFKLKFNQFLKASNCRV